MGMVIWDKDESNPPLITLAFYPIHVHFSNSISLLTAELREWGIESQMVMLDQYSSPSHFSPDTEYVGFSCITRTDYLRCLPFIKRSKELGKVVLLGGPYAHLNHPVSPLIDHVCRGDGEGLPQFLLTSGESGWGDVTPDLNSLPIPDYSLWYGIPFDRPIPGYEGRIILPYVSSRGCPFSSSHCSFCQANLVGGGYRVRSMVNSDLTSIIPTLPSPPDLVYFLDATLPYMSREWRDSWEDLHIPFICMIRADIDMESLEWLIGRGMVGCGFGIESGDEEFRNGVLKKGISDTQILDLIGILSLNGVGYSPFYIMGHPEENWLVSTRTAKMIKRVGGYPMIYRYEDLNTGLGGE